MFFFTIFIYLVTFSAHCSFLICILMTLNILLIHFEYCIQVVYHKNVISVRFEKKNK